MFNSVFQIITYGAPRLDVEEVDAKTLYHEYNHVHDVKLPGKCFDTDGVDILIEDAGERCEDEAECEALCADTER